MRVSQLACVALFLALLSHQAGAAEICGNGADDDGNGMTDEGCYPTMTTGVCESPLSCSDTGMVSWLTGSLHYDLPPDVAPAVPFGPGIAFQRYYTSQSTPGTNPATVNKSPLGAHWQHSYLTYIYGYSVSGSFRAVLHTSDGRDVLYSKTGTAGGWDSYAPQAGEHVLSLKQNTTTHEWRVQLLTGETLVYNSSGQLSEIWDTLAPTPNKVLVVWTSTTNGNVQSVTDANGKRRIWFTYSSNLLTAVTFQTKISGSWTNQHATSFSYTTGVLMSATSGGQLSQQYTYTGGNLSNIADGAGNRIAAFGYSVDASGNPLVRRVDTSRGTVGFEYSSTRTSCSGKTLLYFNKANTTSCATDTDCGTGAMCGGHTGAGATGTCFQAGRCLTTSTVNGESVVTNVAPIGAGGGSCTGACTDVMNYVWASSSGLLNVTGRQDPASNYTSVTYNANGLPEQIGYGDTDGDPTSGANRTLYLIYDTTFPGRLAETRRHSDDPSITSACSLLDNKGCAVKVYSYSSTDNQLSAITQSGQTLDSLGATAFFSATTTFVHDSKGRISEIDGAVSGIKTIFDYSTSTDPNIDGFLVDYKLYKDATNYLMSQVLAYDFWGHPTSFKGPDGNLTCDTYDSARGYLLSRRLAMAGQTTCATTNSADITTSWTRDSYLRLTQKTRPDGSCLHFIYDSAGRLFQTKRRDDCLVGSAGDMQQFIYNADGLVTEVDTYNESATIVKKDLFTYFQSRRLQQIVNPVDTSKFTGMTYDARGLVTQLDEPANLGKTISSYDLGPGRDGRVTKEELFNDSIASDKWDLSYSWSGDQSSVTDEIRTGTQTVRDDLSRVVKVVSSDTTYPELHLYDAAGRMTTVLEGVGGPSSAQHAHTYTFDNVNRLLVSDYSGACPAFPGFEHPEVQRAYDALPPGVSCPTGVTCNNLAGRLAYVKATLLCSTAYGDGALDQETFYSYDAAGRIVEEYIRDDSGRTADQLYQWTKNGALSQFTTPSSAIIGWTYGSTGTNSDTDHIRQVWRGTTTGFVDSTIIWFPYGGLKEYKQQSSIGGIQLYSRITRNLAYRITGVYDNQPVSGGGGANHSVVLTEDAKGRVTKRDYTPSDPTLPGVYDSYFLYDYQDRITCETTTLQSTCPTTGGASALKNNHSLSPPFTSAGDWTRVLRQIPGTNGLVNDFNSSGTTYGITHQVADVNQSDGSPVLGHTTFGYDTRGNRSYDDNTTTLTNDRRDYTYDERRNVINVRGQYYTGTGWHYYDVASAFDGDNRRVYKSFYDETTLKTAQWFFYYDPHDRLTEVRYTPDTATATTYSVFQLFWIDDRLTAYWQTDYPSVTTSKRYVGTDETGRPIDMWSWPSTGDAARVWSVNPSAWGIDTNVVGPTVFQPVLFAGQYVDSETIAFQNNGTTVHRPGLAVNGFRTYDPFTGAYLQVDPAADATRSAYIYAASDPIGSSDPTGLMACTGPETCTDDTYGQKAGYNLGGNDTCSWRCEQQCGTFLPDWGCDCNQCSHGGSGGYVDCYSYCRNYPLEVAEGRMGCNCSDYEPSPGGGGGGGAGGTVSGGGGATGGGSYIRDLSTLCQILAYGGYIVAVGGVTYACYSYKQNGKFMCSAILGGFLLGLVTYGGVAAVCKAVTTPAPPALKACPPGAEAVWDDMHRPACIKKVDGKWNHVDTL